MHQRGLSKPIKSKTCALLQSGRMIGTTNADLMALLSKGIFFSLRLLFYGLGLVRSYTHTDDPSRLSTISACSRAMGGAPARASPYFL